MAAMTDLDEMLRTLTVSVRPQRYTFITVETGTAPPLGEGVEAVIREDEADTIVATVERAAAEGWPQHFVAVWLTLDVHSALEALGLPEACLIYARLPGQPEVNSVTERHSGVRLRTFALDLSQGIDDAVNQLDSFGTLAVAERLVAQS